MSNNTVPPGGYPSANDLPSIAALREQLRAAEALTRFVFRKHRAQVTEIKRQLEELTGAVDHFYQVLGDRNWIFHDDLNVERVAAMLSRTRPVEELERRFIEEKYGPDRLPFMAGRLRSLPAMQLRADLINKALADYDAGRYYAVVLVLISVMDGFVNDLDPGDRKGLHARDESELHAWDSVVGHHAGLARAHRAFTKPFKATVTEPVYELHRNGIVHGNLVNFDNVIVAAKAWNRLFAVADWARARVKQAVPPEPQPKWRDVLDQMAETSRMKKVLAAWQPSVITPDDEEFDSHPAKTAVTTFLDAWASKRWALMAAALPVPTQQRHGRQIGREIKDMYSAFELRGYRIESFDFVAAAMCVCTTRILLDTGEVVSTSRWRYETQNGKDTVIPPDAGVWRLVIWDVGTFVTTTTTPHQPPHTSTPQEHH